MQPSFVFWASIRNNASSRFMGWYKRDPIKVPSKLTDLPKSVSDSSASSNILCKAQHVNQISTLFWRVKPNLSIRNRCLRTPKVRSTSFLKLSTILPHAATWWLLVNPGGALPLNWGTRCHTRASIQRRASFLMRNLLRNCFRGGFRRCCSDYFCQWRIMVPYTCLGISPSIVFARLGCCSSSGVVAVVGRIEKRVDVEWGGVEHHYMMADLFIQSNTLFVSFVLHHLRSEVRENNREIINDNN